ncbi:MAG: hypothetical protein ACYC0Q_00275 [Eubacteriales bacterium]
MPTPAFQIKFPQTPEGAAQRQNMQAENFQTLAYQAFGLSWVTFMLIILKVMLAWVKIKI